MHRLLHRELDNELLVGSGLSAHSLTGIRFGQFGQFGVGCMKHTPVRKRHILVKQFLFELVT